MKADEIDHLLHLQQLAYGLLLWTGQRAETDPSALSDLMLEKWRSASSTESWLRETSGAFPVRLRPSPNDFQALANLFSAFFQTSFHVAETYSRYHGHYENVPRRRLVPGLPAGSKSTQAKKRIRESMRQLRLAALNRLASDARVEISPRDLERLERRANLREPLALWTWFLELERRAQFASQGVAVYGLWKAMEPEQRQDMDSARILAARDALLKGLCSWSETMRQWIRRHRKQYSGRPTKARDINHMLRLQRLAHGLLLWIGQRAETDPSVLSDTMLEKWSSVPSTEAWLRESSGILPVNLRPSRFDFKTLAVLFSALFQTPLQSGESFSCCQSHYQEDPRRWFLPGVLAGCKSTQAKKQCREFISRIRLAALGRLASGAEIEICPDRLEQLECRADLKDPLARWTYFEELERRVKSLSHGPAIHGLWNAMDAEQRQGLSYWEIQAAHDTLLKALADKS